MLKNPIFKCCFEVESLQDRVIVFNEVGNYHTLEGNIYVLLAPFLRGAKKTFSTDGIVESLNGKASTAEIYYALLHLEQKGLIEESTNALNQRLRSFCHLLEVPLEKAIQRIETTTLSLHRVGSISPKILEAKLKSFSLKIAPEGDFTIVLTDHYRRRELEKFHRDSLKTGKPWLLIKPAGVEIWIGPLFIPKETGCFHCLLERLENNHIEEKYIESLTKKKIPLSANFSGPPLSTEIACGLAANEVFKWVVQGNNRELEGKVISYTQLNMQMESHLLVKNPHCSSCGKKRSSARLQPFIPQSQKIHFSEDGGYRTVFPEETFQKYKHHITPITGVIGKLEQCATPDPLIQAYGASHVIRTPKEEAKTQPLHTFRHTSGGKGMTRNQSKTSCLCEALEGWSGIFRRSEVRKRGSYRQLKKEAIDPRTCLLFSEKQYQNREEWNRENFPRHWVPIPFEEEKEVEWTPLWSLTEQRWKWLPTALCFYNYDGKERFCGRDSNGSASGNTKEEAFLQGFLELIERDNIAIWWYNRLQMPAVDLHSFQNRYFSSLLSVYAKQQREVWMLDVTMDIPIPTFVAISRKVSCKSEEILMGFGSHLDPQIAASRALTEMNQMLPLTTPKIKSLKETDPSAQWLKEATLQKHPYLLPDLSKPLRTYSKREAFCDLKDAILFCQKCVEEKGMEVLVLDQTRPDIGLPVMQVVVPGLRHFWNRFEEGRLYDVPVQLGLFKKKLKEEELNPLPMFI